MKPLKSERAAKLAMTKLDKAYDAAIDERNAANGKGRESGFTSEIFAECDAAEAKMKAVLVEMDALDKAARALGFYAGGRWYRYFNSTHAALVADNMD